MIARPILDALDPLTTAFEELGVSYVIVGSVASSAYGVYRATVDVDMVVRLLPEHVGPLVESLQAEYYIDADMLMDAIEHRSSFNLIYLASMTKIDLFVAGSQPLEQEVFRRAQREELGTDEEPRALYLSSPEDLVLRKLEWYKAGGGISERQWLDVLGVLKVQANALDYSYLSQWAGTLGVDDLLEQALGDAGLDKRPEE